ncbi:unnamed protein product [Camellia sinensis]
MECGSFELHQSLTGNGHTLTDNPHNFSLSKPWPILPSYLPWSLNPNVPFRSCESYFGNGFTRRIDLLKSSLSHHRTGGWFRCFYSETLRSSICEGGRVRMHPDKIRMSIGGERLEAVMGRGEDEELPVFESGAFDVEVVDRSSHGRKLVDDEFLNQYVQFGADSQHTMRGLVDSVKLVGASDFQCSEPRTQKLERIADDLLSLNKLERFDYSVLFRLKMGLDQYGPAVSGLGGSPSSDSAAGPGSGAAEAKVEKTAFDVKLEKFDAAAKIKVIKEVRAFTDLGLKEAKDLVEKAPVVVKKGVAKEEADSIVEKLKALGATVMLE